MTEETTELIPIFKGVATVYAECSHCGQAMQYMTDNSFNFCPFCGRRVTYKTQKGGNSNGES